MEPVVVSLLVAVVSAVSAAGAYVLRSVVVASAAKTAAVARAWVTAREQLGGDPQAPENVIEYRNQHAAFRLSHREEGLGQSRQVYTLCEIHGLYATLEVSLAVFHRDSSGPLAWFDTDATRPEFVRKYRCRSRPAYLGDAFFDAPTRAFLLQSKATFLLGLGVMNVRLPAIEDDAARLVAVARDAEYFAKRWMDLLTPLYRLAHELDFEATLEPPHLVGVSVLGRAVRRGRTWVLELLGTEDRCEVVVRTEQPPHSELRFVGLEPSAKEIATALEAKEEELSGRAYR